MDSKINIPFSRPSLSEEEVHAVKTVLEGGWLTTGPEAFAFEKEFTHFLQSPHLQSLAVNSCTAGLHLAYKALDTSEAHEVISTPLTFISSVNTAIHCGAKITFIDTAPNSLYPHADSLEKLPPNKAHHILTLVPIAGYHPYYPELLDIAAHRKLRTIEDAAHTLPAQVSYQGQTRPYGTVSDIGVYSFYANKTVTTGEGGMIVSHQEDLIQKMNLLRNHGMSKNTWDRYTNAPSRYNYDIIEMGFKYNMPDILASIGRIQLQKARSFQKKRHRIAKIYHQRLSSRDYWTLPEIPTSPEAHSWHLFILQLHHPRLTRDEFMAHLGARGIGSSVHFKPLHLMSYFKNTYGYTPEQFPHALSMYQKILSIPLYPDLDDEQIDFICKTIIDIGDNN